MMSNCAGISFFVHTSLHYQWAPEQSCHGARMEIIYGLNNMGFNFQGQSGHSYCLGPYLSAEDPNIKSLMWQHFLRLLAICLVRS